MKLSTPALLAMGITCVAGAVAMQAVQIAGFSLYFWRNPFDWVRAWDFARLLISRPVTLVPLSIGVLCVVGAMLNAILNKRPSEE